MKKLFVFVLSFMLIASVLYAGERRSITNMEILDVGECTSSDWKVCVLEEHETQDKLYQTLDGFKDGKQDEKCDNIIVFEKEVINGITYYNPIAYENCETWEDIKKLK